MYLLSEKDYDLSVRYFFLKKSPVHQFLNLVTEILVVNFGKSQNLKQYNNPLSITV